MCAYNNYTIFLPTSFPGSTLAKSIFLCLVLPSKAITCVTFSLFPGSKPHSYRHKWKMFPSVLQILLYDVSPPDGITRNEKTSIQYTPNIISVTTV